MFLYSLAAFVVAAPVFKGGNRMLPLLLLELAAIAILLAIALKPRRTIALPLTLSGAIGILVAYPLIQIVPLPEALWAALPGHAEYAQIAARFGAPAVHGVWRAISVMPGETFAGWLALLPPLACLIAATQLSTRQCGQLLLVVALAAGLESMYGLLQAGAPQIAAFSSETDERNFGTAVGTFANRNHLASLLAMALPVLLGLIVSHRRGAVGHALDARASEDHAQRLLLFAAATMVLLCLLFTRSRAGIATAIVGLVFAAILFWRTSHQEGPQSPGVFAAIFVMALIALAAVLTFAISMTPVVANFESERVQLGAATRIATWIGTLHATLEFLPFGSGLSTFPLVYPRFHLDGGVEHAGVFMNAAHNDYLQAFMELGAAGIVVVVLLLAAYVRRIASLASRDAHRRFALLQLAAGAGLLPPLLHSVVDFPMHIPANAMWCATLAGVLFHRESTGHASERSARTSRRRVDGARSHTSSAAGRVNGRDERTGAKE